MSRWLQICGVGVLALSLTVSAWADLPQQGVYFSAEEDFVTRGPEPPDGNPIMSDGDLLHSATGLFMRNAELLTVFNVTVDLGLDAVDVVDEETRVVAFSTSLDAPRRVFLSGDLLATNGMTIPNQALLARFGVSADYDLGLDAVHFTGAVDNILAFLDFARDIPRDNWLNAPDSLAQLLETYGIDIRFSTEGSAPTPAIPSFIDGDLLSVVSGSIVFANSALLPADIPAGIPSRGVDFGLDAAGAARDNPNTFYFSTEILSREKTFSAGDIHASGAGVVAVNGELLTPFALSRIGIEDVGLDALTWPTGSAQVDVIILEYLLGRRVLTPSQKAASDTNSDGGVDIADYVFEVNPVGR